MTLTADHRPSTLPVSFEDDTLENIQPDPDSETSDEIDDLDRAAKQALVDGAKQDIAERKKYAKYIYRLTVGWLILMGVILVAQGLGIQGFHLDNSVLIALVTTTTGGIVGLLGFVVTYLFKTKE